MSCSSSAAIASRDVWSAESVPPWTSRLAGLLDRLGDVHQRLLGRVLPAHRVLDVALVLPVGAQALAQRHRLRGVRTDRRTGGVISLPEAAFICVLRELVEMLLRSASTLRWTIEVVMRIAITAPPFRSG